MRWAAFILIGVLVGCGGEGEIDAGHDTGTDTGVATFRPERSLVIALDGVRPDALAAANTPNLDALIAGSWQPGYRGAYTPLAQNLYDAVTISGPNHAAIMTGATGAQHGVTGNDDVASGDYDTYRHYLRVLEEDDPDRNTACLFTWPVDRVITSRADYVTGGDDATNVARVAAIMAGTHTASRWNPGTEADAVFLFLDDPDHAGHAEGFEASVPAYLQELEQVDAQLGTIFDAIAGRPRFAEERWQIVLTSDHGGFGTGHGGSRAVEHTIPFLVVSQDVRQGRLPGGTENLDVAPTVLTHMGVSVPSVLTGTARGQEVETDGELSPDLLRHYRFDGDLSESSGRAAASVVSGSPTLEAAGGRFGGFLALTGEALSLGVVDVDTPDAFTVTLWVRARSDGNLVGNLGAGAGWSVGVDAATFGASYTDGTGTRLDVAALEPEDDDWHFVAAVFRDHALAVLYLGKHDGGLRWSGIRAPDADLSEAPVAIGPITGDVDELAIWSRALSFDEVHRLHDGVELSPLTP